MNTQLDAFLLHWEKSFNSNFYLPAQKELKKFYKEKTGIACIVGEEDAGKSTLFLQTATSINYLFLPLTATQNLRDILLEKLQINSFDFAHENDLFKAISNGLQEISVQLLVLEDAHLLTSIDADTLENLLKIKKIQLLLIGNLELELRLSSAVFQSIAVEQTKTVKLFPLKKEILVDYLGAELKQQKLTLNTIFLPEELDDIYAKSAGFVGPFKTLVTLKIQEKLNSNFIENKAFYSQPVLNNSLQKQAPDQIEYQIQEQVRKQMQLQMQQQIQFQRQDQSLLQANQPLNAIPLKKKKLKRSFIFSFLMFLIFGLVGWFAFPFIYHQLPMEFKSYLLQKPKEIKVEQFIEIKTEDDLFDRFLFDIEKSTSYQESMQNLLRIWGYDIILKYANCLDFKNVSLNCKSQISSLDELLKLNHPALVELYDATGLETFFLVLVEQFEDQAIVFVDQQLWKIPLSFIENSWTSRYDILWRSPNTQDFIDKTSEATAITWLQLQLKQYVNDDDFALNYQEGVWDETLENALESFQHQYDLVINSSQANWQVIMFLNQLSDSIQMPKLTDTIYQHKKNNYGGDLEPDLVKGEWVLDKNNYGGDLEL